MSEIRFPPSPTLVYRNPGDRTFPSPGLAKETRSRTVPVPSGQKIPPEVRPTPYLFNSSYRPVLLHPCVLPEVDRSTPVSSDVQGVPSARVERVNRGPTRPTTSKSRS